MTGWVTIQEGALRLGVSTRTVWRMIRDHNLETSREYGRTATFVHLADLQRARTATVRGNPHHQVNRS